MMNKSILYASVVGLVLSVSSPPSQAVPVRVNMTVDNSYALFYGIQTAATNFVGSDFNWPTTETYNFNLTTTQYLYVVTASDLSVAQGFLGQFENLDTGYKFYSNDPQWQGRFKFEVRHPPPCKVSAKCNLTTRK